MHKHVKPLYAPALRLKAGEIDGLRQLAIDVADRVQPRLIIPPSKERDDTVGLFSDIARTPHISDALADAWRRRVALLDATYIMDEFGRESAADWLPAMFKSARSRDIKAIPCASIGDLQSCADAFRASISLETPAKIAIVIPDYDLIDPELAAKLSEISAKLTIIPSECIVIADFAESEFEDPEIVAPIISGALETLQSIGLWNQVIFQASHYPSTNPAPKEGGCVVWPRNEWKAWQLAVKFDPSTADHMIFGDYAADCSRIEFKDSSARAIRHIRYATPTGWRVQRAPKEGTNNTRMNEVYKALTQSKDFAGVGFSAADDYIKFAADDASSPHGNAKTWRQLNTTHHLTQVVSDIARVRGVKIEKRRVKEGKQTVLFPS